MPTDCLPERDAELLRAHDVGDANERLRWLQRLADAGDALSLYANTHAQHERPQGCPTIGLRVDQSAGAMELMFDPTRMGAGELTEYRRHGGTAVGLLDGVRLQFDVQPLPERGAGLVTGGRHLTLRAALPTHLARLQRREAFRVTPLAATPAQLWMPLSDRLGDERRLALADISATGLAFFWPMLAGSPPPVGTLLEDCRLELPASLPIRCTLIVSDVTASHDAQSPRVRVGCAIGRLDSTSARAIQVYVNTTQVLPRAKRPRVATETP